MVERGEVLIEKVEEGKREKMRNRKVEKEEKEKEKSGEEIWERREGEEEKKGVGLVVRRRGEREGEKRKKEKGGERKG